MSLASAVAAPSPVTLAGKTYHASPVDLFGLGELEEHARARIMSIAAKGAATLPGELGDRLLDRAIKLATSASFDSDEFNKFLTSKPGMLILLTIALRPRHPTVTPDDVARLTKDRLGELLAAFSTVLRISGFAGEDDAKAGQQPGESEEGAAESSPSSATSSKTTDFSPATLAV